MTKKPKIVEFFLAFVWLLRMTNNIDWPLSDMWLTIVWSLSDLCLAFVWLILITNDTNWLTDWDTEPPVQTPHTPPYLSHHTLPYLSHHTLPNLSHYTLPYLSHYTLPYLFQPRSVSDRVEVRFSQEGLVTENSLHVQFTLTFTNLRLSSLHYNCLQSQTLLTSL